MKMFKFFQDLKVKVWQRYTFYVEAETKEEALNEVSKFNTEEGFVSDSPYLHVFYYLDCIHHQIDENKLSATMESINYYAVSKTESLLPNEKNWFSWISDDNF